MSNVDSCRAEPGQPARLHLDTDILTRGLKGKAAAFNFLRSLRLARNAVSLGSVETLACHPRTTTHSSWTAQALDEAGISHGLVRISVGIEDWRDLLADFESALEKA